MTPPSPEALIDCSLPGSPLVPGSPAVGLDSDALDEAHGSAGGQMAAHGWRVADEQLMMQGAPRDE